MGNNESTEPFTSNMYNRRVLAGEFTCVNKYLLRDLVEIGLWTADIRNQIIADKGSVQNISKIPKNIKDLYKTVWEIKQKVIIDQAADRGAFICQSQSLNIHIADPTTAKLTSMHFYAWKKGLKTGMYYLRTKAKADAIQFTVDQTALANSRKVDIESTTNTLKLVDINTKFSINKQHITDSPLSINGGNDTDDDSICESCSA